MNAKKPLTSTVRAALMATLRDEVARYEGVSVSSDNRHFSCGIPALDGLLPLHGLRPGTLMEYLTANVASGAGALAMTTAREACEDNRALVVVAGQRCFYPPAAACVVHLDRTIVLRTANDSDQLWAADQALRCPGVGAVWLTCSSLDVRDFRRLQLAAEVGGTLGLLFRPAKYRGQPTWADVQWLIEPRPSRGRWRLRATLTKCRGGPNGSSVSLEFDEQIGRWQEADGNHATHPMPIPAQLADSAIVRCQSRA